MLTATRFYLLSTFFGRASVMMKQVYWHSRASCDPFLLIVFAEAVQNSGGNAAVEL